jgi:hypothetical protein
VKISVQKSGCHIKVCIFEYNEMEFDVIFHIIFVAKA